MHLLIFSFQTYFMYIKSYNEVKLNFLSSFWVNLRHRNFYSNRRSALFWVSTSWTQLLDSASKSVNNSWFPKAFSSVDHPVGVHVCLVSQTFEFVHIGSDRLNSNGIVIALLIVLIYLLNFSFVSSYFFLNCKNLPEVNSFSNSVDFLTTVFM